MNKSNNNRPIKSNGLELKNKRKLKLNKNTKK